MEKDFRSEMGNYAPKLDHYESIIADAIHEFYLEKAYHPHYTMFYEEKDGETVDGTYLIKSQMRAVLNKVIQDTKMLGIYDEVAKVKPGHIGD